MTSAQKALKNKKKSTPFWIDGVFISCEYIVRLGTE
jgi:hypothetical protein